MSSPRSQSLIRPLVQRLHAYVPGEQPNIKDLVKLNTNENPYPPSPKVLKALKAALDGRLRLYPNPKAQALREQIADLHGCSANNVIVGNGSDELLALATRAFVEPVTGTRTSAGTVQFFTPSYSLYPVLADIHGAAKNGVPLTADFGLPPVAELRRNRQWDFHAALTFITTPNAPSGRGYTINELDALCRAQRGVVVLDEAYVDFAPTNAFALSLTHPNVLVARTFSKAYSLCFQRVGYCVGQRDLIEALDKIRDSYNVNGLGQIAAVATLGDLPYYQRNFKRILATRERTARELAALGFTVLPSQTNFLLVRPPKYAAQIWQQKLRDLNVLVRWFSQPEVRNALRISIGTDAEMNALLAAARKIVG